MTTEPTFLTDNLKLACALASAGFSLAESPERIVRNGREVLSFSFNPIAHGVKADDLASAFIEGDYLRDICMRLSPGTCPQ